jgi:hypothetical protein
VLRPAATRGVSPFCPGVCLNDLPFFGAWQAWQARSPLQPGVSSSRLGGNSCVRRGIDAIDASAHDEAIGICDHVVPDADVVVNDDSGEHPAAAGRWRSELGRGRIAEADAGRRAEGASDHRPVVSSAAADQHESLPGRRRQ